MAEQEKVFSALIKLARQGIVTDIAIIARIEIEDKLQQTAEKHLKFAGCTFTAVLGRKSDIYEMRLPIFALLGNDTDTLNQTNGSNFDAVDIIMMSGFNFQQMMSLPLADISPVYLYYDTERKVIVFDIERFTHI